jgi:hypothetical protein
MELLGITDAALVAGGGPKGRGAGVTDRTPGNIEAQFDDDSGGDWDPAERQTLNENIQARRPFLDFVMHRRRADGSQQQFRISGEPMFDRTCRFTGYRGLGVEVL